MSDGYFLLRYHSQEKYPVFGFNFYYALVSWGNILGLFSPNFVRKIMYCGYWKVLKIITFYKHIRLKIYFIWKKWVENH